MVSKATLKSINDLFFWLKESRTLNDCMKSGGSTLVDSCLLDDEAAVKSPEWFGPFVLRSTTFLTNL